MEWDGMDYWEPRESSFSLVRTEQNGTEEEKNGMEWNRIE